MVGFTAMYEHIAEGCNMLARPRGWSVFAVACVLHAKVVLGHELVLQRKAIQQLMRRHRELLEVKDRRTGVPMTE